MVDIPHNELKQNKIEKKGISLHFIGKQLFHYTFFNYLCRKYSFLAEYY